MFDVIILLSSLGDEEAEAKRDDAGTGESKKRCGTGRGMVQRVMVQEEAETNRGMMQEEACCKMKHVAKRGMLQNKLWCKKRHVAG